MTRQVTIQHDKQNNLEDYFDYQIEQIANFYKKEANLFFVKEKNELLPYISQDSLNMLYFLQLNYKESERDALLE